MLLISPRRGLVPVTTAGVLLLLNACAPSGGSSSTGPADDLVEQITEIGSCDALQGAAESFLDGSADLTGSERSCTFFLPEQVDILGEHFWRDVHAETIPFDIEQLDDVATDDFELIASIVEAEGLELQDAPADWTFAGEAPGKLDLLLVARNGNALHCDASAQPGGGSTGAIPPAIDLEALLAFCTEVRDLTVEKP
jgi:hypothetical protein